MFSRITLLFSSILCCTAPILSAPEPRVAKAPLNSRSAGLTRRSARTLAGALSSELAAKRAATSSGSRTAALARARLGHASA